MIGWVICLITVMLSLILVVMLLYLIKRQDADNRRYRSLIMIQGGRAVQPGCDQNGSLLYDELEVENTVLVNVSVSVEKLPVKEKAEYMLTMIDGDTGQYFQQRIGDYLIVGRRENDSHSISINYQGISRNHCKFSLQDGNLYVEDLNSTNHTYLNGAYVSRPQLVMNGDMVYLGSIPFSVYLETE